VSHHRTTLLSLVVGVTSALVLGTVAPARAAVDDPPLAVAVNSWDALRTAFADGGTVQLTGNVVSNGGNLAVSAGDSVTLDLNGHDLTVDNVGDGDAGISVPATAALTITDTTPAQDGSLSVIGGTGGAGIGGDDYSDGGTVNIAGGNVTARTFGGGGAGIGGGIGGRGGDVHIGAAARVTASADDVIYYSISAIGPGRGAYETGEFANAGELTIPANARLRIAEDATVTNTGTIRNHGSIEGSYDGTLDNRGTILNIGSGRIDGSVRITGHNYLVSYDPTA
jgi:hypothetical protein